MPNRKLLEITRALSADQHKRLKLFLKSPYFSNGYNADQIVDLYDQIAAAGSDPEHTRLDKYVLSRRFFPNKPYAEKNKNPIDSLASDLLKLVKRFILAEDREMDMGDAREHLALARFYRKHNLEDRFWQHAAHWKKNLEQITPKESLYFFYAFLMEEEIAAFRSVYNTYSDDANLVTAHRNLDTFYLINKLEFTCALMFQSRLGKQDPETDALLRRSLLDELTNGSPDATPLQQAYVLILQLLEDKSNQSSLEPLEQLLVSGHAQISPVKFRNLQAFYRYLAGSRFMLRTDGSSLQQMFQLYREHLEAGYLFVEGKLMPATLKSLVNLALKLGHFDWAEQFLATYDADRITGTKFPQEAHRLCLAELKFYQKDYEAANKLLIYRHFENVNYSILVDVLQIKIYFETQDELLESRLQALTQKVRRARIAKTFKDLYLNFIKIVEKIDRHRWQWTPRKKSALLAEISHSTAILDREWLLNVLNR